MGAEHGAHRERKPGLLQGPPPRGLPGREGGMGWLIRVQSLSNSREAPAARSAANRAPALEPWAPPLPPVSVLTATAPERESEGAGVVHPGVPRPPLSASPAFALSRSGSLLLPLRFPVRLPMSQQAQRHARPTRTGCPLGRASLGLGLSSPGTGCSQQAAPRCLGPSSRVQGWHLWGRHGTPGTGRAWQRPREAQTG